jgi:uncharacterized protein (TIGR02246 family)
VFFGFLMVEAIMDVQHGVILPDSTLEAVPEFHRQETHSVERAIEEFVAAWNAHDPKAMAAKWAEDGDLITPWGDLCRGGEQVQEHFAEELRGVMKTSAMEMMLASVRWIADNIVVVDAECTISRMSDVVGREMPVLQPHIVLVMSKINDGWQVLSARPYEFSPQPGTAKL